ncbi:MAG: ArnT family glycosyltransferase [Planctomycetota bacterium]
MDVDATAATAPARGAPAVAAPWSHLLTALSAIAALLLVAMVAQRVGYPFELEWMEGAMVDEAVRVRHGQPTYGPPGVDHVPFLYTPLLYWVGALAMTLFGESFLAMRAVAVGATLLCAWLVFHMVRRDTGSARAGLWAVGLLCAGYGWLRSWYDLGRNDMLFLATMLGTWCLLRRGTARAAAAAGAVAVLAFLAKQTALLWLPALVLAALVRDRRRGAWFAAVAVGGIGVAVLLLELRTDGWFSFYAFTMPRSHTVQEDRVLGFFTQDLVPVLPLLGAAATALVLRWRQDRAGTAATALAVLGALAASYASRLHVGGFDNVLAYGFAALLVTAPWLAVAAPRPRQRAVGAALLALQFALLAVDVRALWAQRPTLLYDPAVWLPKPAHRHASEQLLAFAQGRDGPVWLLFHGHMAAIAGKAPAAHGQALHDLLGHLLQPGLPADDRAATALQASAREALASKRFAAIVLEQPYGASFEGVFGPMLSEYQRLPGPLIDDAVAIRPTVGMVIDTPYALVPKR